MRLQTKLLLILASGFLFYGLFALVIHYVWIFPSYAAHEQAEAIDKVEAAVGAIHSDIRRLDRLCQQVVSAHCLPMRPNADAHDYQELLPPWFFESHMVDVLYVCDERGRILWGRHQNGGKLSPLQSTPWAEQTGALLAKRHHQNRNRSEPLNSPAAGIVTTPQGPMIITSSPLPTAGGGADSPAVLLVGRFMDQTFAKRIANQTRLDLDLAGIEAAKALDVVGKPASLPSSKKEYRTRPLDRQRLEVKTIMPDIQGQPVLQVRVRTARSLAGMGFTGMHHAMLSVVIVVVIAMGAMLLLFQRTLLKPLTRLTRQVLQIGQNGSLSQRIEVKGRDEIGQLAREFNRTLENLEVKSHALATANNELQQDITKRQQVEKELRIYESIVEASRDLMALVDRRYVFLAANRMYRKAHGLTPKEIIGHGLADILGTDFFHQVLKPNIVQCLAGKEIHYQTWFDFAVLGRRFMDVFLYPYYDFENQIAGVVINSRDITCEKSLEKQIRQSQKMEAVGTLAGGIAHEFNNILGIILGNTELAHDDVPASNPARENLQEIMTACARAREIVQQLLSFSRQADSQKQLIDITPIVKETIKFLRSSIPANVEIQQHIPAGLPKIAADPSQIHQLLVHLCINASQAISEGKGRIVVALDNIEIDPSTASQVHHLKTGPYLKLAVTDSGQGIPVNLKDRIFEPYFTTKEMSKVSGLGLSVVHGIVKDHNGTITLESDPGQGTTFTIFFPVETAQESPQDSSEASGPDNDAHILFVDDETALVNIGRQSLKRLGYRVTATTDPAEALRWFRARPQHFDLVITDMSMPKLTGEMLIEELLAIRADIPIILSTGFSEHLEQCEAVRRGVRQHLHKPFDLNSLSQTVRRALAGDGA